MAELTNEQRATIVKMIYRMQIESSIFRHRKEFQGLKITQSTHFPALLIWMNDPPPISFKTDTKTIIALLSKGFRATSPLRFAPTREKDVSSFDCFQESLVVHNRSEGGGSVDCVILRNLKLSKESPKPKIS
jgi:hypothetical protein